MTTIDLTARPASRHRTLRNDTVARRRRIRDEAHRIACLLAVGVAVVPLLLVVGFVLMKGITVVGPSFFTQDIPAESTRGGGMAPAVIGTVLVTGAAALMAIPLGVAAAVYLSEFGRRSRLAGVVRFLTAVMTGVPSIVMGLFVYALWVLRFGQSGLAGAVALACLMLPIVITSSEEMLRLVPDEIREGSAALGAPASHTALHTVLPEALPGIVTGSLLAIARAAGETAPLLFTIGATRVTNLSLFEGTNAALPAQIFRNAALPYAGAQQRAWGAALTLIAIVMLCMVAARAVTARFNRDE